MTTSFRVSSSCSPSSKSSAAASGTRSSKADSEIDSGWVLRCGVCICTLRGTGTGVADEVVREELPDDLEPDLSWPRPRCDENCDRPPRPLPLEARGAIPKDEMEVAEGDGW